MDHEGSFAMRHEAKRTNVATVGVKGSVAQFDQQVDF